jgi:hypothetical protein
VKSSPTLSPLAWIGVDPGVGREDEAGIGGSSFPFSRGSAKGFEG